jgi:glycerol-3-phosphate acyltransferase PlsX
MNIGVDAVGGDFAPGAIISGALLAFPELRSSERIVLFGPEEIISGEIRLQGGNPLDFIFVNTTEIIEMGEHPAKAFSKKTDSSIAVGFRQLLDGQVDGFASAGNTGAMLVGAMYTLKTINGVIRPCISATLPRPDGSIGILLDVGINADCRPDVLYQYGILGSLYAEYVHKIPDPRIGLVNIGEEEEKGNLLTKATHELMKGTSDFNFIGNIEGNEFFKSSKADVMICDGFTGNILLKQAESFYTLIKERGIMDSFFERFNFENYGGTPILGINGTAIIAHGASNAKAIKNMILHTRDVINAGIPEKIKQLFT